MLKEDETPIKLCKYWDCMMPGCYAALDKLRAESHERFKVDDLCDLPISAAGAYLQQTQDIQTATICSSELAAVYMWRKHKIIYDFDETLAQELCVQAEDLSEDTELPIDILFYPPYPCVYIKSGIPSQDIFPCDGFFAWIEEDVTTHVKEFRVQFVLDSLDKTAPVMLELTDSKIGNCIKATKRTSSNGIFGSLFSSLSPLFPAFNKCLLKAMQLYLYVCSDQADMRDNPEQKRYYKAPSSNQFIKDRFRELDVKDVGVRIGNTLRLAKQMAERESSEPKSEAGQGNHKRPHTRRGHWHHYWTGPKDRPEQRKLILKWTHPILVGGYPENVVVFPVKE